MSGGNVFSWSTTFSAAIWPISFFGWHGFPGAAASDSWHCRHWSIFCHRILVEHQEMRDRFSMMFSCIKIIHGNLLLFLSRTWKKSPYIVIFTISLPFYYLILHEYSAAGHCGKFVSLFPIFFQCPVAKHWPMPAVCRYLYAVSLSLVCNSNIGPCANGV